MITTIKQHIRSACPLLLIMLFAACAGPGPEVVGGVSQELARHRAATISNINYALELVVPNNADEDIAGMLELSFDLAEGSAPLQLDFRESADKIRRVFVNDSESSYQFENEHIVIPARELEAGSNVIRIRFTAGSTSLNRSSEFLYTLFVPDRARTAFPLFDQPDLKATYDLTLTVPKGWAAMSNAPAETVTESVAHTVFRFARSDLISSYLFSFVTGKFDTVTRDIRGRSMVMLHRETDEEKVARNIDDIFELHADALDWLEEYTGIEYPYQKFGFALIPAFQYGGMEHVGAIQYRADGLFLDESPSDTRLLGRAGLIAHETAHMWFGNLVTMEWFDDVWTKEVFANFMAAKIVNPGFPDINHDLNFLVRHYPSAYSVDRTTGANPIRQALPNLSNAGQMYGAIIYNKAPIMMRQLELMIGPDMFREGMQEYLEKYAFDNATWPALVEILDRKSEEDLKAWSNVWVNTAGRPEFDTESGVRPNDGDIRILKQLDPAGLNRTWPQTFAVTNINGAHGENRFSVLSAGREVPIEGTEISPAAEIIFNSDGLGYGIFPTTFEVLDHWDKLNDVEKGSVLINLYETMLEQGRVVADDYFKALSAIVVHEQNQLLLDLALGQMQRIYWSFLPVTARQANAVEIENILWRTMGEQAESSRKKIFFDAYAAMATSPAAVRNVYDVWSGTLVVDDLPLSENDRIDLAQAVAIRMPGEADEIVAKQVASTGNADNMRKLDFIAPSLSADETIRAKFFASLADEKNRAVESWVLEALENIHHPLRSVESEQFILPSLELLQEVQITGDIFFPKRWLDVTLGNYRSGTAVHTVRTFLDERPEYDDQLRMKILQSSDTMFRANSLVGADRPPQ